MCSIYRVAELRRASPAPDSLGGRIAYRLTCSLRSPELSEVELHSSQAR